MNDQDQSLAPGLYFVATPIGAARDITLRALDILASADVLAAEDTRNTRHLLEIHGVALNRRPLIAYHDHNGPAQRPRLLAHLRDGKSVAYVSDAGTPLIADPGFVLAREAIAAGYPVTAAPGPSALLAALTLGGLPTDRFYFGGFLPPKTAARKKALAALATVPGTLAFFESPKRVGETLTDMVECLGGDRDAALCRELTKKFEDVQRASLADLATRYGETPPRGEVVLLVGPPPERMADGDDLRTALRRELAEAGSLRDAVDRVADMLGLPRKEVYRAALELEKER